MRKRIEKTAFDSNKRQQTREKIDSLQRELRGEKPASFSRSNQDSNNDSKGYKPRFKSDNGFERKPRFNQENNEGERGFKPKFKSDNGFERKPRFNQENNEGERGFKPKFKSDNGFERKPRFNQENNEGERGFKPRFKSDNGFERKPRFNQENNEGERGFKPRFKSDNGFERKPRFNQENNEGEREFKPRFKSDNGFERKPRFNQENNEGEREFKPRFKSDNGFERKPRFNQENNEGERGFKPRFKSDNGFERKPRFNQENNEGERGFKPRFKSDNGFERKPRFNQENNEGEREFKPRFKSDNGFERKPRFNQENNEGEREFKPRFKSDNGFERKPRFNQENNEGERGFKPRFKSDNDFERKPRFNQDSNEGERGFKPRFKSDNGFEKKSDFDRKPRFNQEAGESNEHDRKPRKEVSYGSAKTNFGGKNLYKAHRSSEESAKWIPNYNLEKFKESAPVKIQKKIEKQEKSGDSVRLNRYIANAGICSRREADELIRVGEIKVNGQIVTEMGYQVKAGDIVKYGNRKLSREKLVYVLLNKPKDFITTTEDPNERKTVMDLVKNACEERIYPVGRLDRNTTGLLLLTNDGELADKLTHPSNEIDKVYQVELNKALTTEHFDQILKGVTLEDGEIRADELSVITPDSMVIGIRIHSGRNRIVRRIFESLGYEVLKLDRTLFAGLNKKDLPRGMWRFLGEKEVIKLKYML